MTYEAHIFDPNEYRYFSVRYLYYTKKEIKRKIKIDYPDCKLIRIK